MSDDGIGVVWHLVIEGCGLSDRVYHRSLHHSPQSARNKAQKTMRYDIPELEEWYERPPSDDMETQYTGYVLDRDEIGSWPIRIEVNKEKILNE